MSKKTYKLLIIWAFFHWHLYHIINLYGVICCENENKHFNESLPDKCKVNSTKSKYFTSQNGRIQLRKYGCDPSCTLFLYEGFYSFDTVVTISQLSLSASNPQHLLKFPNVSFEQPWYQQPKHLGNLNGCKARDKRT